MMPLRSLELTWQVACTYSTQCSAACVPLGMSACVPGHSSRFSVVRGLLLRVAWCNDARGRCRRWRRGGSRTLATSTRVRRPSDCSATSTANTSSAPTSSSPFGRSAPCHPVLTSLRSMHAAAPSDRCALPPTAACCTTVIKTLKGDWQAIPQCPSKSCSHPCSRRAMLAHEQHENTLNTVM